MRPIVAMVGNVDEGKSTLTNALVGKGIVAPYSPLRLTSALSEIRVCKDRAHRCFGVKFADGEETDVDIQDLWHTMSAGQQDIERLILYAEPSALLEHLRLIDLPGLQMDHDEQVLEFLDTETPDVLVNVVSESDSSVRLFEVSDTAAVLPCEHVIVVNKMDRCIDWADPAVCLEKVVTETEERVTENVKQQTNAKVVAVSGLVGLASDIWTDHTFEGVIHLAEPGDLSILSKHTYFGEERTGRLSVKDRQAVLDAANVCFQGPWIAPDYCKPAWPALMFAIGVTMHHQLKSPDAVREAMRRFSNIERLRSVLLSTSQSDRIKARQDALGAVGEAETERLRLRRSIAEVGSLLESTDRLATTVVNEGLGHTEERKYFSDLKAFLETREVELSVCLREKQQWLSKMQQAYQETTASDE